MLSPLFTQDFFSLRYKNSSGAQRYQQSYCIKRSPSVLKSIRTQISRVIEAYEKELTHNKTSLEITDAVNGLKRTGEYDLTFEQVCKCMSTLKSRGIARNYWDKDNSVRRWENITEDSTSEVPEVNETTTEETGVSGVLPENITLTELTNMFPFGTKVTVTIELADTANAG